MLREEDARRIRRRRLRDTLAIGALLCLLAAALASQGWAWRQERLFYDLGLALAPRAAPDGVVIVAIDEPSVAALGRWPWRRAVHSTLLQRLAQARPRAVMLDLVLSEPDPDPAQDVLLAQSLRAAAPVVVPLTWYALPGEPARVLEPVPALRGAARLAQAEAELDADGILRHAFLQAGIGATRWPHAALALLEAGGQRASAATVAESAPPGITPPQAWARDERVAIRFQGPAGHLERVSYIDVLTGAVAPETLRGKYVLVGMTAAGLGDSYATPMSGPQGEMPGIEVVGQLLVALRGGDQIRSPPAWALALGSSLVVLALLVAFWRLRQRWALALSLALFAGALGGSVVLVGAGWWVSPVGVAAAALLAYPLWSWRRLEATAAALTREIARLDEDAALAPSHAEQLSEEGRLSAFSAAALRLRRARRFLAASLDGLPEAVLLADATGRVTLGNRRAAALFEVGEASELAGLSLARLLGEFTTASAIDWSQRLAEIAAHGGALSLPARLAGHGDFLIDVASAPDADGPRLIAACADIGPLKAAERAREETLAFITHDLRSPLSSIALMADFERRGLSPRPSAETIAEIERLARRGLELSEGFVRLAQAESKVIERTAADLAELVSEVVRDLAPQAQARQVSLATEGGRPGAHVAQVDRELVARAMMNLVGNALKYGNAGGVVTIGLHAAEGGHLFSVQDQGPGLDPQRLSRLFRAYVRSGAAAGESGVGLGLQFVQRVAERHGGYVRAHSVPGQGARFELFLPAAAATPTGE
ncbi:MAG TPA: CHASE2 domain-containing protein [Burkholderiaceae bacterium]|nr:CHASE2 domain-containing protein [Burkholderiaceae bacterium]